MSLGYISHFVIFLLAVWIVYVDLLVCWETLSKYYSLCKTCAILVFWVFSECEIYVINIGKVSLTLILISKRACRNF